MATRKCIQCNRPIKIYKLKWGFSKNQIRAFICLLCRCDRFDYLEEIENQEPEYE